MKEKSWVIVICIIYLIIGLISGSILTLYSWNFNFHTSHLEINQENIIERLDFTPNKPYHTLYRNFLTPLNITALYAPEITKSYDGSILINSVSCKEGDAYANINHRCFKFPEKNLGESCIYTEPNEYGCTFGNSYGFKEDRDYWIESGFTLQPNNLIKIKDKYYIKFVAYSKNNHPLLIKNKNFFIEGEAISKTIYLQNENVVIYINYKGEISKYNIINQDLFNLSYLSLIVLLVLVFFPAALFFSLWYLFGRENYDLDFPEQLSFYPRERRGWKVAAYFNPPFSVMDRNFFASMLLDLYRRKIIQTQLIDKEVYIHIAKPTESSLDEVEKDFLELLAKIYLKCPEKYKNGNFFNLKKASKSFWVRGSLQTGARILEKQVKEHGKKYLDRKVMIPLGVIAFLAFIFIQFGLVTQPMIFLPILITAIATMIIARSSSILIRFKGEYYKEYLHWQAFKKYISKSESLKEINHKGVILWDQHLVYASALGVAKKVIKELKNQNLISEKEYLFYMGSYNMSGSFATSSGTSGSGGGGVGGGGVGGGGGGGR